MTPLIPKSLLWTVVFHLICDNFNEMLSYRRLFGIRGVNSTHFAACIFHKIHTFSTTYNARFGQRLAFYGSYWKRNRHQGLMNLFMKRKFHLWWGSLWFATDLPLILPALPFYKLNFKIWFVRGFFQFVKTALLQIDFLFYDEGMPLYKLKYYYSTNLIFSWFFAKLNL